MSPVDALGGIHTVDDAGQVEETFLGHEDLLVPLDCGEGLCDKEKSVRKCLELSPVSWLLVTLSRVII